MERKSIILFLLSLIVIIAFFQVIRDGSNSRTETMSYAEFEDNASDRMSTKAKEILGTANCSRSDYYKRKFEDGSGRACFQCGGEKQICLGYSLVTNTEDNIVMNPNSRDKLINYDDEESWKIITKNLTAELDCECSGNNCKCMSGLKAEKIGESILWRKESVKTTVGDGRPNSYEAVKLMEKELGGSGCLIQEDFIKCEEIKADIRTINNTNFAKVYYHP